MKSTGVSLMKYVRILSWGDNMRLKRLEIYGFKSFADKTVIEFPQGITAIVGPNGSGKSNIVDAVRWVLGEQSAHELRGERVEDLIFNGSAMRRKLGFAQVSLTFDNSDGFLPTEFSEILITRKAYRSGESEYYINKARCRLKDIQDLFLDTGLGKNSFAMVGQGQVESIIEAKPKDRRLLFDEAAGINKYKAKKDETLRKLERTEIDLARVTDIAGELENRIEPLKEAKEKATIYLDLTAKLTKARENLVMAEAWELFQSIQLANRRKTDYENELIAHGAKLNRLESSEITLKEELRELDETLMAKQNKLYQTEQELQNINADLRVIKEKRESLKDKVEIARNLIKERNMQITEKENINQNALGQETNLKKELAEIKALLQQKQQELNNYLALQKQTQQGIEELKDLLFEKSHQLAEKRNEKARLNREIELLLINIDKSKETLGLKQEESSEKKGRIEELEVAKEQSKEKGAKILAQLDNLTELIKLKETELKTEQQEFSALEDVFREKSARLKALQATEAEYAGYQGGVRAVLKASLPGIMGPVARLITVSDQFTKAAEAVLGSQLQGLVTITDVAAENAITYLKEKRLGKATFYPLNLLEARVLPKDDRHLLSLPGVLGLLADYLDCDKNLRVLADFLGGRTFVTDNLTSARALAHNCKSRYRIVTLDGEVINSGGTMTGGEEREERVGLLKRQALVGQLQKECEAEGVKLAQGKKALEAKENELKEKQYQLVKIKEELQAEILNTETLSVQIKPIQSLMEGLSQEIEMLRKDIKDNEEQLKSYQIQLTTLDKENATLMAEEAATREKLKSLTEIEWTDEAKLREEYQALKDREIRALERVNYAEKERKVLEAELVKIKSENEETFDDLRGLFFEETKERLQALEKNQAWQVTLLKSDFLRQILTQNKEEKASLIQKLENCEAEIKKMRPIVSRSESDLREASTELARLEGQKEATVNKAEELGINLESLSPDVALPSGERHKLNNFCKHLDREITELGAVNIGAIDEFKEVSERYNFLSTQINDLVEAKTDLLEVLTKLDKASRERFQEAFLEIKAEFEKLYKVLFGGGEATLVLEEGDLLEAGVDIKAQPPGKKLQNIALLSGGEKALTAIALIFAVLCVRQVPFYLLDEIDAPLDEANLERYSYLIKEKAKTSQIILITHRRRSMESAHLLYGVAMEEKGVSKILTLRLEDEQAAIATE